MGIFQIFCVATVFRKSDALGSILAPRGQEVLAALHHCHIDECHQVVGVFFVRELVFVPICKVFTNSVQGLVAWVC